MSGEHLMLERQHAALLIVDVQERLAGVMPERVMADVERNLGILIEAARRFEIPVVVSEQYPKGLGPTCKAVQEAIDTLDAKVYKLEKTEFSVCAAEHFGPVWDELYDARTRWIVAGMETHICVYQTARDLVGRGLVAHVVADAVVSRREQNWKIGLSLCERAGSIMTSTETVVMDLLGQAGGEDFKAISRMIR